MEYKAVLVHVEPTEETRARLACAVDLADRFNALLIGCGCEADSETIAHPFVTGSASVAALKSRLVDQNIEAARLSFEHAVSTQPHRWVAQRLAPTDALALHGRSAELIVASATPRSRFNAQRHVDAGLLVAIAGRPILVTPPGGDYLRADRVLVCWKDTREARRAVADALPFLRRADDVLVVEVVDPGNLKEAGIRTGEVAEALCRHGVFAHSEVLVQDQRSAASILEERASGLGADLIVAGGYGRSRLGEWAFGGVTAALLQQAHRFVLLSH